MILKKWAVLYLRVCKQVQQSAARIWTKYKHRASPGHAHKVVVRLEKSVHRHPDNFLDQYRLGSTYVELGRFRDASRAFEAGRRLNPKHAAVHYQLGRCYAEIKKPLLASIVLERAIKINPNLSDAHYILGRICLQQLNNPDRAIMAFKETLRLDPQHITAYLFLGSIYLAQDRYLEALKIFRRATRSHPENVLAHAHLGRTYLIMGNFKRALSEHDIVRTLDTDLALVLMQHIQRAQTARHN